jgi:hypothetical protein
VHLFVAGRRRGRFRESWPAPDSVMYESSFYVQRTENHFTTHQMLERNLVLRHCGLIVSNATQGVAYKAYWRQLKGISFLVHSYNEVHVSLVYVIRHPAIAHDMDTSSMSRTR